MIPLLLRLMSSIRAETSETFKRIQTNVLHTPLDKVKGGWELDTQSLVNKSTFTMKPSALISRTREVLDRAFNNQGSGIIGLAEEDIDMESFRAVICPGSASTEIDAQAYLKLAKKGMHPRGLPELLSKCVEHKC